MSVVLNNIRSYWVVFVLFFVSCSQPNSDIVEKDQELNRALFDVFLKTKFNAHVQLPEEMVLTAFDQTFYKWSLKKEKKVKVHYSDEPDVKVTFFDTQDSQLHIIYSEVRSNENIISLLDSVNKVVWSVSEGTDSVSVLAIHQSPTSFEGKWCLNNKVLGGNCKATIIEKKGNRLLCYYMSKEFHDPKNQMTLIGDSVLNAIEFFD